MALFDNRHWLLSHIRNSFISSDDSGMCEAVIIENVPREYKHFGPYEKFPDSTEDSTDDEDRMNNSLDMHTGNDLGGHRLRTNTAQRLAKLELQMQKAAQVKHIKWEPAVSSLTAEQRDEMFARKEVRPVAKNVKSLLTQELIRCPMLPRNPFAEYAKFDGRAQVGMPVRTYRVFLTMLPPADRNYPITVCVLGSAKVSELIGFVLWKYTAENTDSDIKFKETVDDYGLYIAEDDGEVDWDFSCLDPKETVGKFGLAYLALVELSDKATNGEMKKDDTDESAANNDETDSSKIVGNTEDIDQIEGYLTAIEALVYQTFRVNFISSKLRSRTAVVLGVSGDRVEIDPAVSNSSTHGKPIFGKGKVLQHASYPVDDVVACTMDDVPKRVRAFRIVRRSVRRGHSPRSPPSAKDATAVAAAGSLGSEYQDHQLPATFKTIEFEADAAVTDEIVRKLNCILRLKSSVHRREYMESQEQKTTRRRSFNLWPR